MSQFKDMLLALQTESEDVGSLRLIESSGSITETEIMHATAKC